MLVDEHRATDVDPGARHFGPIGGTQRLEVALAGCGERREAGRIRQVTQDTGRQEFVLLEASYLRMTVENDFQQGRPGAGKPDQEHVSGGGPVAGLRRPRGPARSDRAECHGEGPRVIKNARLTRVARVRRAQRFVAGAVRGKRIPVPTQCIEHVAELALGPRRVEHTGARVAKDTAQQ